MSPYMRLTIETRAPLTCVELMDWFYSLGYLVYDVKQMGGAGNGATTRHFTLEASQETARRLLHEFPSKHTSIVSITALQESHPDFPRNRDLRPH